MSNIEKLSFKGHRFDGFIHLYLEDFADGEGKLIVESHNDAWSYYWRSMGEGVKIKDFIASCDKQYLSNKLIRSGEAVSEIDYTALVKLMKRKICEDRYQHKHTKEEARELYNLVAFKCRDEHTTNAFLHNYDKEVSIILGNSEWYFDLPEKDSASYKRISRIVQSVIDYLNGNECEYDTEW